MEKISVCIAAYNEEQRIGLCLDSVLSQQGVEIAEILVGINSSTDRTRERVEGYAKHDARVRVVDSPKGKTNAWNALNAAAAHDLRIFHDGDCVVLPRTYLPLVQALDGHVIVGASVLRNTRGKSPLVKILNFPDHYASSENLNGTLYLASYRKVKDRLMRKLGQAELPSDVINEDAFLSVVCEDVVVSQDIFVEVASADSIEEEIIRHRRMNYGDAFMRKQYPVLMGRKNRKFCPSGLAGVMAQFRHASIVEKLLFPFALPIKMILFRYIHFKARQFSLSSPVKWK